MNKFLLIIFFLFYPFAYGSEIQDILPSSDRDMSKVVSGSVSYTVDMTLDNCIKIALGNNPEILSAFEDILVNDSKIKQIWSNYFPQFSWQTSWAHIKQLQLSDAFNFNLEYEYYILGQISLQQLLYDFGVTQNQATIQRLGYESSKKTFAEVVNDVIYRTKNAYYEVLYSYEAEKVAQMNVDNYQAFFNQANALYSIGFSPKIDVTIAHVNLSKAKMELISAKNFINTSIAKLNNVMGIPYIKKYNIKGELSYNPMNFTFEDTVQKALDSRPELKRVQIDVEKANENVKLQKKAYFPQLEFDGYYQAGGKSWTSNNGWQIGVYLNFPIINGALIYNQIKEANHLYNKELARAKAVQNKVYLEIQTSYLKLHEKENQLPVATLQVKQALENYELSKGRYMVGEASPIEMREAQNTLADSKLQYYKSLYEYNIAKSELERSIGANLNTDKGFIGINK